IGGKKGDAVTRMLEASAPALAKPLQPKTEKDIGKLKLKLSHAGFRSQAAPQMFLGIKVILLVAGLVLGGGTTVAFLGVNQGAIIRAVLIVGGLFFLPDIALWWIAKKRK